MRWSTLTLACGLAVLLGAAAAPRASACFIPPLESYMSHEEAIRHAEWIARVQVRLVPSSNGRRYLFTPIEVLKGEFPADFSISAEGARWVRSNVREPSEYDAYAHAASTFWARATHERIDNGCSMSPTFDVGGEEYLLFGPGEYGVGFENVSREDDLWLRYVRDRLSGPGERPFPVPIEAHLDRVVAVVRLQAEFTSGELVWSEETLLGERDDYAKLIYADVEAVFRSRLDPDCWRASEEDYQPSRQTRIDEIHIIEFLPTANVRIYHSLYCLGRSRSGSGWIEATGVFSIDGHRTLEVEHGEVRFRSETYPTLTVSGRPFMSMPVEDFLDAVRAADRRR